LLYEAKDDYLYADKVIATQRWCHENQCWYQQI